MHHHTRTTFFLLVLIGGCSPSSLPDDTNAPGDVGPGAEGVGAVDDAGPTSANKGSAPSDGSTDGSAARPTDLFTGLLRCGQLTPGATTTAQLDWYKRTSNAAAAPTVSLVGSLTGAEYTRCNAWFDPAGHFVLRPVSNANVPSGGFYSLMRNDISPVTGALSAGTPLLFPKYEARAAGAVHPSGKFAVFEASSTHELVSYAIGASSLTESGRQSLETPFLGTTTYLAFHPNGKFLYATAARDVSQPGVKSGIVVYSFNDASGAITTVGHFDNPASYPFFNLVVKSTGDFLVTSDVSRVVALRIDPTTGALSQPTYFQASQPKIKAFASSSALLITDVDGSSEIHASTLRLDGGTGVLSPGTTLPAIAPVPVAANQGLPLSAIDGHCGAGVGLNGVLFDYDAVGNVPGPSLPLSGSLPVRAVESFNVSR